MGSLAFVLLTALNLPVPFVPQDKDTCGAASLAMVLRYWRSPADPREIASTLLEPNLQGIKGSRLESFARARGMQAIAYEGDEAQLRDYLSKGRPLIVAWKLSGNRYHNVVVTGFDEDRKEVLVNDPAVGAARRVAQKSFEKRWSGAGHWTLLVLPLQEEK